MEDNVFTGLLRICFKLQYFKLGKKNILKMHMEVFEWKNPFGENFQRNVKVSYYINQWFSRREIYFPYSPSIRYEGRWKINDQN